VCDPQADRAAALARKAGAAACGDPERMLDEIPVDAVYVCVPPGSHGAPERAALRRGLPLFVEKPLDADLTVAEELAAEIEAAGVPTATGYHWRYFDTVERAVELLAGRPPRLLIGSWLANDIKISPPAADPEFLRRVSLDLIGRVPTLAETRAFLSDGAPDRRVRLVEARMRGASPVQNAIVTPR